MKITLPVPMDSGFFMAASAELLFDIAPHLAHVGTFAVHKEPLWDRWNVSNVETGLYVTKAATREEAIEKAKAKLARQTPANLLAAYRKGLREYGWVGVHCFTPSGTSSTRSCAARERWTS